MSIAFGVSLVHTVKLTPDFLRILPRVFRSVISERNISYRLQME